MSIQSLQVMNQSINDNFSIYQGDCFEIIKGMPDNSIDFSIYSPPFSSLFTYSASERDAGNCKNITEFAEHYKFLHYELLRVLKPGRLLAIHCMMLPSSKQNDGVIGLKDFRGELIRLHLDDEQIEMYSAIQRLRMRKTTATLQKEIDRSVQLQNAIDLIEAELKVYPSSKGGFIFHSEVCIRKDPVTAMTRTKSIRLLYKQLKKDSTVSGQAIADYVVIMRKPGINPDPVTHTPENFPLERWQRYAEPVWNDINPGDTLQKESAREAKDERHICPLQLPVIQRCLELWTNPNDIVLSPFTGIGSEGFVSVKMGRRFVGIELKRSYYDQSVLNLERAVREKDQKTLFDLIPDEEEAGIDLVRDVIIDGARAQSFNTPMRSVPIELPPIDTHPEVHAYAKQHPAIIYNEGSLSESLEMQAMKPIFGINITGADIIKEVQKAINDPSLTENIDKAITSTKKKRASNKSDVLKEVSEKAQKRGRKKKDNDTLFGKVDGVKVEVIEGTDTGPITIGENGDTGIDETASMGCNIANPDITEPILAGFKEAMENGNGVKQTTITGNAADAFKRAIANDPIPVNINTTVEVGQIYESTNPNTYGRQIEVMRLAESKAQCKLLATGNVVMISLDKLENQIDCKLVAAEEPAASAALDEEFEI